MPRVEVAGGSIAYEIAGHGEDFVVFISGLNGRGDFWQPQVEALSPHFRTLTFDHRGIGGSAGAPPYAVEQWARDVVALLDHLDIGAAHLVGHSTGGAIAQVVASEHPERVAALVLGATWAQPDERFRLVFELRRDVLAALGVAAYSGLAALMTSSPGAALKPTAAESVDPVVTAARIEALLAYQGFERLRRISRPTLVIAAADDFLIPTALSRVLAEEIAGARWAMLPSGGHAFPRSMTSDYNRLVLDFLAGLARQKPAERAAMPPTTPRGQGVRP
jgi:aminoacrylate hydrolase